ncbi:RICIN domain-containing protein [Lentzea tibetensis]|uniref:RICIN domain-containing protein n=1 Tax=Lentzea tibetensis TaxID=2591470 RepID=UPI0016453A3D|nr:RICIN domain-containing protein [Lentzea tibetensis]
MKKLVRGIAVTAAALALALTSTVSSNAEPDTRAVMDVQKVDGASAQAYGHIINNNSGMCLAVPGGSTQEGLGLIQWGCGGWEDHYWQLEPWDVNGVRHYQIRNARSQQCLAVPGNSQERGVQVIQWGCGQFPDHFWRVIPAGGKSQLKNFGTGQCLAIPGASKVQGERVIQWPCGTFPDHYWR